MRAQTLIFLLAVLVVSCRKPSESKSFEHVDFTYHLAYELSYNEATDTTSATAVLIVKDTTSKWKGEQFVRDEFISFANTPLLFSSGKYSARLPGKVSSGSFLFHDNKGRNFLNPVVLPDSIAGPDVDTVRSSNNHYVWLGKPVGAGETVYLRMSFPPFGTSYTQTFTSLLLTEDKPGSTGFALAFAGNANQWNTLTFQRAINHKVSEESNGGSTLWSYYAAKSKRVFLKD